MKRGIKRSMKSGRRDYIFILNEMHQEKCRKEVESRKNRRENRKRRRGSSISCYIEAKGGMKRKRVFHLRFLRRRQNFLHEKNLFVSWLFFSPHYSFCISNVVNAWKRRSLFGWKRENRGGSSLFYSLFSALTADYRFRDCFPRPSLVFR